MDTNDNELKRREIINCAVGTARKRLSNQITSKQIIIYAIIEISKSLHSRKKNLMSVGI